MKRITLGSTGLQVSPMSLGTAGFGLPPVEEKAAFEQMDRYLALGGNFIDTAHSYNDWVPGETCRSEKLIGRYLKARGSRDRIVLSTKGAHPTRDVPPVPRLDPGSILSDLRGSLDNLGTDYVDLYFLHRDDPGIPVGELVDLLEEQRVAGLIGHYGFSNWQLERAQAALDYARLRGVPGFEVNQIQWSLARVNVHNVKDKTMVAMSADYHAFHQRSGLALMAYTSLAKGYLSKRLRGDSRAQELDRLYRNPHNEALLSLIRDYCGRRRCEPGELAVRWFQAQPFAAVPIVSFSSLAQLEEVAAALRDDRPPLPDGLPAW